MKGIPFFIEINTALALERDRTHVGPSRRLLKAASALRSGVARFAQMFRHGLAGALDVTCCDLFENLAW